MSSWFQNNKTFRFEGTTLGEALQVEFRSKDDDIFIEVPAYIHIFENLGYINSMLQFNMRLSVTRRGYLGWADARAQAGDRIAILLGCSVPVILRPRAEGGWCLVGDAIIPGLMNGEGLEDINIGELGYISLY
jgi:hypothetical protein